VTPFTTICSKLDAARVVKPAGFKDSDLTNRESATARRNTSASSRKDSADDSTFKGSVQGVRVLENSDAFRTKATGSPAGQTERRSSCSNT